MSLSLQKFSVTLFFSFISISFEEKADKFLALFSLHVTLEFVTLFSTLFSNFFFSLYFFTLSATVIGFFFSSLISLFSINFISFFFSLFLLASSVSEPSNKATSDINKEPSSKICSIFIFKNISIALLTTDGEVPVIFDSISTSKGILLYFNTPCDSTDCKSNFK